MKTILACLLTLAAAVAVAQTKISVTLDHADAMYDSALEVLSHMNNNKEKK